MRDGVERVRRVWPQAELRMGGCLTKRAVDANKFTPKVSWINQVSCYGHTDWGILSWPS